MPSTKVRTAGVVFELLVPTPRMNKEGRAALGVTRSPPTKEVRSSVLWTTALWRLSEENAWSEIGTSCATSARRCAVTTISSICPDEAFGAGAAVLGPRSEEHTSELQSLMRNSYAVFCLKTKKQRKVRKHYVITNIKKKSL